VAYRQPVRARRKAAVGIDATRRLLPVLGASRRGRSTRPRETPNNVGVGDGLVAKVVCDGGVLSKDLRFGRNRVCIGFPVVVFGVKTESGRGDQARLCASSVFLTITRLASANRVRSCAVFLAKPR